MSNKVVAVLAYDGVSAFELGIAVEMFGLSGLGYRVLVCADRPRRHLSANGVKIIVDAGLEAIARAGTIIVPGWQHIEAKPSDALLAALKHAHARFASPPFVPVSSCWPPPDCLTDGVPPHIGQTQRPWRRSTRASASTLMSFM